MSKHTKMFDGKHGLAVEVRGNNIEQAIRTLGRKIKQEGLMRELRARTAYEKPSARRKREQAEAVSRQRKNQIID